MFIIFIFFKVSAVHSYVVCIQVLFPIYELVICPTRPFLMVAVKENSWIGATLYFDMTSFEAYGLQEGRAFSKPKAF